jgi:large subunit ribosomal protein L21
VVYAIVRAGGRQEKVAVGHEVVMDRVAGAPGDEVELKALLLVDGDKVTSSREALAKVKVTAEILDQERGKKINIFTYKNKSGQSRRKGHRQELTRVKITGIA